MTIQLTIRDYYDLLIDSMLLLSATFLLKFLLKCKFQKFKISKQLIIHSIFWLISNLCSFTYFFMMFLANHGLIGWFLLKNFWVLKKSWEINKNFKQSFKE